MNVKYKQNINKIIMGNFNKYNKIGAAYFERKDKINFGKRMNVEQYGLLRANKKH